MIIQARAFFAGRDADPGRRLLVYGAIATSAIALALFAYYASVVDRFPWEERISTGVQSWRSSWLDTFMKAVSMLGNVGIAGAVVVATSAWLVLRGWRSEGAFILYAALSGYVISFGLKELVGRPRPPQSLVQVITETDGYSFPSGHVMHYVVFLGSLAFVLSTSVKPGVNRWLIQGAVLAVLMAVGLSRIYLGVHWPSDVLGGYAVGAVVAAGTIWVWLRWTGGSKPAARPDQAA